MPRPDQVWLEDILAAAIEIRSYVEGVAFDAFVADSMRRNATVQQFTVIGEAASHLTDDLRQRYPDVARSSMIGFRNVIVHGYFRLTWKIVWDAATVNVLVLAPQIAAIPARSSPRRTLAS
jgi:uncharacterized protein with HEPN domain